MVQSTYVWDISAVAVVRRILTAHCNHLRPRVSVGLEAPKGNQRRQQSGKGAEQTFGSNVWAPPQQPGSVQGPLRTRVVRPERPDLSVRESSTKENVKSGDVA